MKDSKTLPARSSFVPSGHRARRRRRGHRDVRARHSASSRLPRRRRAAWSLAAKHYITVHPDNTFTHHRQEPRDGPGHQGRPAEIIADEFDVDWSQVKIQQADLDPKFGPQSRRRQPRHPDQLRSDAANRRRRPADDGHRGGAEWNVPAGELTTGSGVVTHAASKRTATYASLSARVAAMPPPTAEAVKAAYKDPTNFKIIGKPIKGVDNARHRHRQAGLQHRRRAARHAVRRVREVSGVRRQGRSAPISTRSSGCPGVATRSSSKPSRPATTDSRPAWRSSPTAGGWPTMRERR